MLKDYFVLLTLFKKSIRISNERGLHVYKVIEVKQSIFEDNNKDADLLRQECKEKGVFLLNIMSSPGSGV